MLSDSSLHGKGDPCSEGSEDSVTGGALSLGTVEVTLSGLDPDSLLY